MCGGGGSHYRRRQGKFMPPTLQLVLIFGELYILLLQLKKIFVPHPKVGKKLPPSFKYLYPSITLRKFLRPTMQFILIFGEIYKLFLTTSLRKFISHFLPCPYPHFLTQTPQPCAGNSLSLLCSCVLKSQTTVNSIGAKICSSKSTQAGA